MCESTVDVWQDCGVINGIIPLIRGDLWAEWTHVGL